MLCRPLCQFLHARRSDIHSRFALDSEHDIPFLTIVGIMCNLGIVWVSSTSCVCTASPDSRIASTARHEASLEERHWASRLGWKKKIRRGWLIVQSSPLSFSLTMIGQTSTGRPAEMISEVRSIPVVNALPWCGKSVEPRTHFSLPCLTANDFGRLAIISPWRPMVVLMISRRDNWSTTCIAGKGSITESFRSPVHPSAPRPHIRNKLRDWSRVALAVLCCRMHSNHVLSILAISRSK